jgi:hypothetical protein
MTVPGMGMTLANEAGPRRNAAAPPSPAAAGSWSRSVPAARMPLTVRQDGAPAAMGLRARGLEPAGIVLVGRPDDALGGAEPVERVVGEERDHSYKRPPSGTAVTRGPGSPR